MNKNSNINIIYRIFISIIIGIIGLFIGKAIETKYGKPPSISFWFIICNMSGLIGFLYNKKKNVYRILLGMSFFILVEILIYFISGLYYWINHIFK